jgi:hypothetical protein
MRDETPRSDSKNETEKGNEDEDDDVDREPTPAPTRAGSNVPNAGRDSDENRTE